jgi:hypothetical protein
MKHALAHHPRGHSRTVAAILGVVAVAILAVGADIALPYHAHVPIALTVLAVAAYLALHDRIHSVWLTHHTGHAVPSRPPPRRRHHDVRIARDDRGERTSRPSHVREDRPGWM